MLFVCTCLFIAVQVMFEYRFVIPRIFLWRILQLIIQRGGATARHCTQMLKTQLLLACIHEHLNNETLLINRVFHFVQIYFNGVHLLSREVDGFM